MRCVSARKIRTTMGQLWPKKETKWSVHWEIMETQGYLFDIHTKKSETVPFRKRRNCGSPHNKRVMYEIKGKKEVCSSWSSIVWQSHKLSGQFQWKIEGYMWQCTHGKKRITFTQKKENMVQIVYDICNSHK